MPKHVLVLQPRLGRSWLLYEIRFLIQFLKNQETAGQFSIAIFFFNQVNPDSPTSVVLKTTLSNCHSIAKAAVQNISWYLS